MRKDFYTALNIEKAETTSVVLFLVQSVFLGIFYGAFDVGAHALFLSVYPAAMIPKAYVISGLAGIVLTSIYAKIQNKLPFSKLAWINLVFISVATALLRILFQFTESSWLIFLIFVMMGPLNIIALLGFWGAAGRMFSLRQGKRLFGLIDSGQIFGAILSTFAIPVLIAFGFQQKNLLFLSSVSVVGALIIQIIISFKYNLNKQITRLDEKPKGIKEIFKSRYVIYMSVFVVMSMLAAFFIQYSFLTVTKENYPDHNDLTEFLGAFTGSLLLFTFLFKTFVYSKLMKTYGLKFSIMVSSILLLLFTVVASLIGTFSGYTAAANSFIFFFLIIALSRLFSKALKDAVEVPSFKILYQSLKEEIRHDVQAYVDGTINEIAALSAGLLLAALGLFEFFTLIHFSYSLIIILFIWFIVARKLYSEYQRSLQNSLSSYKPAKEEKENLSEYIYDKIDQSNEQNTQIISGLEIDSNLHPIRFESSIPRLVNSTNKYIQTFALHKIIDHKIIEHYNLLNNYQGIFNVNEKDQHVLNTITQIDKSPGINKLISLSKSKSTDDKIMAAVLIGRFYTPELYVYLKALIRDLNLQVKITAIKIAAEIQEADFCPIIIDYIDTPEVFAYAYDALLQFGDKALSYLDQVFYKSGTSHRVSLRVVKMMGEIGGNKAIELLLTKLDHPNEEILYFVLLALEKCGFNANETNMHQIHQIIERQIGVLGWNIAAKTTLEDFDDLDYLKQAIQEELASNYNLLYLLLSLAYDSKSIQHVKENIESGTTEGIGYALELLDLFISEEIKPKLFPVVEDIPDSEKVRQLQNFYALEILDLNELLIDIINRDINFINIWTKACAIHAIMQLNDKSVPDDLIAHIFNPIEFLRESATVAVHTIQKDLYSNLRERIQENYIDEMDLTIESVEERNSTFIFDRTLFLKSLTCFQAAQGRYLYHLASKMKELKSADSDYSNLIITDLINKIVLIKDEAVTFLVGDDKEFTLDPGNMYIMSELIDSSIRNVSIKNLNGTIFYIEKNELIYDMFDYYDIEKSLIKWFSLKESYEEFSS